MAKKLLNLDHFAAVWRDIYCPREEPYRSLPNPVATEELGWFDALDVMYRDNPKIDVALTKHLANPLLPIHLSIFPALKAETEPGQAPLGTILDRGRIEPPYRALVTLLYLTQAAFRARHGALIETTAALDQQMQATDIAENIPGSFFAPPYPATYLHFGAPIPVRPDPMFDSAHIVGAYVLSAACTARFHGDGTPAGVATVAADVEAIGIHEGDPIRTIEIIFLVHKTWNNGKIEPRWVSFSGVIKNNTHDPFMPFLRESVARSKNKIVVNSGEAAGTRSSREEVLTAGLGHVAKVFLYMALPNARREERNERSVAAQRVATLGPKKQAKAKRQLGRLYDRIVVGPLEAPAAQPEAIMDGGVEGNGRAVAPHMRRGHFRSQHHGPQNQLVKLVYIEPILVRADLVVGDRPEPKPYAVTSTGSATRASH